MSKKFLDYEGLLYFWNKIKGKFSTASNWLDGSHTGSVRTVGSRRDDLDYTMGDYATAEGYSTEASGDYSHAEGYSSEASGNAAHAEGASVASGNYSHAEGEYTYANGGDSHAEGLSTQANGECSHSEGYETYANGDYSHSGGFYTLAQRRSQTVIGEFNVEDTGGTDETTRGDYVFIIGNGENERSNALTVDWDGNVNIPSGASYQVNGVPIGTTYTAGTGISITNGVISATCPNITISTSEPTAQDGNNGDIWIVYET